MNLLYNQFGYDDYIMQDYGHIFIGLYKEKILWAYRFFTKTASKRMKFDGINESPV